VKNFRELYGLGDIEKGLNAESGGLVNFDNLTEEQAKKAPSTPMLGCVEFLKDQASGQPIVIGRIPENPVVAITGKGRKAIEQAALNENFFALASGACAFIIKNKHENPKLVLTWRDGGAPTFKFNLHICGGISGFNKRGPDFEVLHPGYVAMQEGKQEILWGSSAGIFDPILTWNEQGFTAEESLAITQYSKELVHLAGLYNTPDGPVVPSNIISLKTEFIKEKQEGVFVVDWENKTQTFTKAHILVSTRSKNIDITKFVVLDFEAMKFEDLHPIYTEEFQGKPLATPLYLVELNPDYTLAGEGKMAGLYRDGKLERFDIPLFNFQMTDPLYRVLDILGPSAMVRKFVPEDVAKKLWPASA